MINGAYSLYRESDTIMKQLLCFGDSNTWGLIPGTTERYAWGTRWTSILQEKLEKDIHVVEEGLCGRTTIFEDIYRNGRRGLSTLPLVLETQYPVDAAILMLGTNDCKSHYNNSAYKIAKGLAQCVDELLRYLSPDKILIVSPIHLGEAVWEENYDPEFGEKSVEVSKDLKREYQKIAKEKQVHFLAASDYVGPSKTDREHLDEAGHAILAENILNVLLGEHII